MYTTYCPVLVQSRSTKARFYPKSLRFPFLAPVIEPGDRYQITKVDGNESQSISAMFQPYSFSPLQCMLLPCSRRWRLCLPPLEAVPLRSAPLSISYSPSPFPSGPTSRPPPAYTSRLTLPLYSRSAAPPTPSHLPPTDSPSLSASTRRP